MNRFFFIAIIASISLVMCFACTQKNNQVANETTVFEEVVDDLPKEMCIAQEYQQSEQGIEQIIGFIFKDMATGEKLTYEKLIINDELVLRTDWVDVYTASKEEGLVVKMVLTFVFNEEKNIAIEVPEQHTKAFKYELKNETLTILDKL